MKRLKINPPSLIRFASMCLITLFSFQGVVAQDNTTPPTKVSEPVKNTFESIWLLDNQTVMIPLKGAFEFDIQHRFGVWNKGYKDFYGLYAPSNIRLGFEYVPIKNLMLGFGFCKDRLQWDFNVKYALVKQSTGGCPLSITYLGNVAIDTRSKDNFVQSADRFAYFNQLMIARKITKALSVQVSPSLSYFNNVEGYFNSEGGISPKMNNAHLAFAVLGRYKLNNSIAIIANYDQPITEHKTNNPDPNLSLGIEFSTGGHAFQIFAGNYSYILPQNNNFYNQNNYKDNQFLIGFNITRVWD